MRLIWKFILPILIVGISAWFMMWLMGMRPQPKKKPVVQRAPIVDAVTVEPVARTFPVRSQGTVQARTTTRISAEVIGLVVELAPNLAEGVLVEQGTTLLRVDDADYQAAVAMAKAEIANLERELVQEVANAERAAEEWAAIGEGEPSDLVLRKPQLKAIRARIVASEAQLAKSERDLERTVIRAPFAGRITMKNVELGQRVAPGMELLHIQAADAMEVILPLTLEQLRFVQLPLRGEVLDEGPEVTLVADIAGNRVEWQGRIARTRPGLDPQTRMVHAVVSVPQRDDAPPLLTGLYLRAEVQGHAEGITPLPLGALQAGSKIFAINRGETPSDGLLKAIPIEVIYRNDDQALVLGDLEAGDRVVTVRVPSGRDGMKVRLRAEETAE